MASNLPALASDPVDDGLWAQVATYAHCAGSSLDPDEWFPVSAEPAPARHEAAAAIAVCTTCPVRAQCLALSLRHWDIGQHGIWGGLVAADRVRLRRRLGDHRGRRGTTVPGPIAWPFLPQAWWSSVKAGTFSER
jgi:WhiB family redox-sensing transcriptional regulator